MRKCLRYLFAIFLTVLFIVSCSSKTPSEPAPKVNKMEAFSLLKEGAAIKPRYSGSPGAAETVKFISENIKKLNIPYQLDKWHDNTPAGKIEFCNVIADIKGKTDQYILIGCHYDTKKITSLPNFEGANDGASGVALLIAMMKAIKESNQRPPASLKFVFFDGEECLIEYSDNDGLYGSRRYADQMQKHGKLKEILAVVILDMIGDKDLHITIPSGSNKKIAKQLLKIAKKQNNSQYFSWHNTDIIDDHTPFQKLDIPAIDIIDFQFGKENRYWHTSADTLDKISPESLNIVGNATLQLLWDIPGIL